MKNSIANIIIIPSFMNRINFNLIFLAILFVYLILPVYADVIEIPEIVVSAERTEQTSKSSAATVNIISADDIAKKNINTFDQVLESIPGITINRSAGTATNSMSIRGSSEMLGGGVGNRVLLLIDGRPAITADTGGANWGLLPMSVVQRVEVVKGALSPLYGSNAMGGVVNVITKSPTEFNQTRINTGAGFYEKPPQWMKYTDRRSYFGDIGVTHSNSFNNLGYLIDLSRKSSDGYRQNTNFSLYNVYGKIQYANPKNLKLGMSLSGTSLERGYPYSWLINNESPYVHPLNIAHEKINDKQEKRIWDFDIFLKSPIRSKSRLSANLYSSQNYSKSLFNPNNMAGDDRPYGFFTDSNARKTGALLQMEFSHVNKNYIIAGLDDQIDMVDSHPPDIMFGKHQAETSGAFALDRISVSDNFSVMLGARYDYRHVEENKSEGQLSPKIGLSYQVNDNTTLRFSAGQAFRSPSLAEIYMKEEINSGLDFKENPNLKSEKLRLYSEIGAKHKLFNLLETDTSVFIYDYTDMIFWKRLDENVYQVSNLSRSVIRGAETGISFSWKGLSAVANYTYIDARDKTKGRTDDTLPYKPKHSAYTALDYQYSRFRIGTSLRYVSKVEEAMFHPTDAPKAFYVVNAKLSCNLSKRVTLSLAVDNVLNRQYEEIERYRMPGRTIVFRTVIE